MKSRLVLLKNTIRRNSADEKTPTRKVKTMLTYVVEAISHLINDAYSNYLEFSRLLRQWGTASLSLKVPSEERQRFRQMNRDAMKAMEAMRDYAKSLCRENYGSTSTQIGEEVYSRAQVCIDAISARSEWCIEELLYREHAYKTSVDSYTNALLELLRRVKRAGDILKKPDEFESVRTYQLYQYCRCIS